MSTKQGSCRTLASLPSDDSDSEYADAVEGEDLEYWVSGATNDKESVSGKPGPSNDNKRNHTSKEMDAAMARNIEAAFDGGETKATPTRRDKPQQHGSEDVEADIPTGSNKNQMKIREFISEQNRHLDINEEDSGSETPDYWESTTEPNDTRNALNTQTEHNRTEEQTVSMEKSNHRETGNEIPEKWKSSTESNLDLAQTGQTTIFEAGNNAQAKEGTIDKNIETEESMLSANSLMDSSNENTSLVDSKGSRRGIVHDHHGQSCASHWESAIYPNFDLDHNDQAATLSTTLDKIENDGQSANNKPTKNISIEEKTIAKEEILSHDMEPSQESFFNETKASSHETRDHVIVNMVALQTPAVQEPAMITCSELTDPKIGEIVKKNIRTESTAGSTVAAASPSLENQSVSKSVSKEEKMPGFQTTHPLGLLFPHESKSTGVLTGTTEESSTKTSTDDLPRCSNWVQPSLESSQCGTEVVDQSQPSSSQLKNRLEQQGYSNVLKPMLLELHGLGTKSRDTVLSTFSSFVTFSNSSLSEGADEVDSTFKEISEPSKSGTSIQDKDVETAENEEIKNETTESNVGEDLCENDDTSLDDGLSTNNIAMMALVRPVSSEKPNADAKKPTSTLSSRINKSPPSADPISNTKIHNSSNTNQANKVTGSASSQIGGPAASSGRGLQERTPAKPDNAVPDNQKVSNSGAIHGTKNSRGNKFVARNMSKSLEEITYVSGPHKEVTYNLRKRPQPSLSGPTIAGFSQEREDSSSKRPRVSSPGMPLPLPFRVSDASPARSIGFRHRQVSGSALLQSPNQVERVNSRTLRKRPNNCEEDSVQEEPPTKKARTSDGNSSRPSKAGSSRQLEEEGSPPNSKPAARSGGSGSSPGSLTLNKTSPGPITNKTPSHDSSQSVDSGPRYNLRSRSAKIETEPVKIREIRNARPETVIRARTVSRVPPGPPLNRANRDRSQNTRPVIIEDKNSSKSKPNGRKPSDSDRRSNP